MITKMITYILVSAYKTKTYKDYKLDVLKALPTNFNIKLGLSYKNASREG